MGSVCHRCEEDRQPECFGSPRNCAFQGGEFDGDNWNCATMDVFREHAYEIDMNLRRGDTSIAVCPAWTDEEWYPTGWIVMTYYKDRGRTSGALFLRPESDNAEPLTWEIADAAADRLTKGDQ